MEEIKWGQDFGDIMDPRTVQKFGQVQGVQGLVSGKVESITLREEDATVRVRITFQAYEVETGRMIWGTEATGSLTDENYRKKLSSYVEDAAGELEGIDPKVWYWIGGIIAGLIVLRAIRKMFGSAAKPR